MSDNSDHFVHLKQVVIPVDFIHYAAPKLRREVYHAFEIANWKACISAPATIRVYKNRMILHSSQLNPKDVGDTLRIFTGLSNAIIAKRQQISEKEKNRSKSTTKSMEWNIFVDNQLDTAVTIIVEDQYPLSESAFASTELLKNDATSIDKRRGILTWRLELEPDEKRTLQHGYTLKFPSGTRLYDK